MLLASESKIQEQEDLDSVEINAPQKQKRGNKIVLNKSNKLQSKEVQLIQGPMVSNLTEPSQESAQAIIQIKRETSRDQVRPEPVQTATASE